MALRAVRALRMALRCRGAVWYVGARHGGHPQDNADACLSDIAVLLPNTAGIHRTLFSVKP